MTCANTLTPTTEKCTVFKLIMSLYLQKLCFKLCHNRIIYILPLEIKVTRSIGTNGILSVSYRCNIVCILLSPKHYKLYMFMYFK